MKKKGRRKSDPNIKQVQAVARLQELLPEDGVFRCYEDKAITAAYSRCRRSGIDWDLACRLAGGISKAELKKIEDCVISEKALVRKKMVMLNFEEREDKVNYRKAISKRQVAHEEKLRKERTKKLEKISLGSFACKKCAFLDRNNMCSFPKGTCVMHQTNRDYGTFAKEKLKAHA